MTDYPDFTVIARLKGEYDGLEKAVALDVEGALQALLYGTYDGANKKLLLDVDGNARMNLYAQDLDEIINRFKYGAPTYERVSDTLPILGWNTIFEISGKGYIYHFDCYLIAGASHYIDEIRVTLDGEEFFPYNFNALDVFNAGVGDTNILQLALYDNVHFRYRVIGIQGYTFETSIKIEYQRTVADNPDVVRTLVYTLI